jgi:PadR family transcriptional regulator PadR
MNARSVMGPPLTSKIAFPIRAPIGEPASERCKLSEKIVSLAETKPPILGRTCGHRIGAVLDSYAMTKGHATAATKLELLQGTLDLMVLQTLDTMGPQHGYGIARRIEQMSDAILKLNEGTVYAALMRLQHRRWISASWGTSEANRKAKFYAITASGKRQLAREVAAWDQLAGLVARLRGAEQS